MAYQLLNWALEQMDISGPAKAILLVLVIRADKDSLECWPSLAEIAADSGFSRRTVAESLTVLESKKKISRQHRFLANSREPDRTIYRVSGSAPAALVQDAHHLGSAPDALGSAPAALSSAPAARNKRKKESGVKKERNEPVIRSVGKGAPLLPTFEPEPKPARRPTPVPDEFQVNDKMREWAHAEGFDDAAIRHQTEKMVDHFRGSGKPKKDWTATWRNWLRDSWRYEGNGNGNIRKPGRDPEKEAEEIISQLAERDRRRAEFKSKL